jgi:VWFA-related protein
MPRSITVSFLLAVTAIAQRAPEPTFHAGTRLVEVDVVARSKGAPAAGLTNQDFTLFDNDKEQEISFFSVHSARATSSLAPIVPLAAGSVSNRQRSDGEPLSNATVLLIDQKNTAQFVQGFAIQRIRKFVQNRRPKDRIAIYTFGRDGLQALVDVTDDADLLTRAAGRLRATDPSYKDLDTSGMTAHTAEGLSSAFLIERAMDTKHVLQTVARHLASVPGRKSVIWITTSFPLFVPELGLDFRPDMEEASRALNDASVALYAVDARGLQGALSGMTAISNAETPGPRSPAQLRMQMGRGERANPIGLDTMNMLAGLTGGLVFFNKDNGIEDSIRAAVDDGELTYALGFYPSGEPDGAWHKLKVGALKRGVSLRYRENYFASRAADGIQDRPTLPQLLRESLEATQLELVAAAAPEGTKPGVYRISVNVNLHDVELKRGDSVRSGGVDVSFAPEGSGTVRTRTLKIEIPDEQFAAFLEKGIDAADSMDVGKAEAVRVVVQDRTTGAAGSVRVPLGKK